MSDPRDTIQRMFDVPNRYTSFGDILTRIRIQGVRCHKNTIIDIESPITAFCGLNGTGKSTILQLAAVAYKNKDAESYYIRDFMVIGPLDPTPFTSDASVEYKFWQNDRSNTPRTISRSADKSQWTGYSRRLERRILFTGIGQYLPKIEQHDFVINKANKLFVMSTQAVTAEVSKWVSNILACDYQNITVNQVSYPSEHNQKTGEIVSVERSGNAYSEAHMGFGEGRTQYIISTIENLPRQSLILIEEPETSLHPSAQFQFGHYLMDVVIRKQHQVFITTHSPFILEALPAQSRIYLKRVKDGIDTIPKLSASQIRSLLKEGKEKALVVLVEDECGAAILRELVRKIDPNFLQSIDIYPAGACQNIVVTVKALKGRLPIIAVLDSDQKPEPKENIFILPGPSIPPEKVLFDSPSVRQYAVDRYGINLEDMRAAFNNLDHHGWIQGVADRVNQSKESILGEFSSAFAGAHEAEALSLTESLKDVLK